MTFEQQSSFLPSVEKAPHHTSTGIPERRGIITVCVSLSAQAQGPFVTLEQNGLWLSL